MIVQFKIQSSLLDNVHADLSRPHPFAFERVGFLSCGVGASDPNNVVILAMDYHEVADLDYVASKNVGALMGSGAIRKALQFAFNNKVCMFHVHRHEHNGTPSFSKVDLSESAKFVPDFWKVRPEMPHGVIVLSHNKASGLCWYPGSSRVIPIREFSSVGIPVRRM